jgi:hypothetical protein
MIEHFVSGGVFPEEDSADPKVDPQRAVAEAVFKKYSAHLVSGRTHCEATLNAISRFGLFAC